MPSHGTTNKYAKIEGFSGSHTAHEKKSSEHNVSHALISSSGKVTNGRNHTFKQCQTGSRLTEYSQVAALLVQEHPTIFSGMHLLASERCFSCQQGHHPAIVTI
jgi:hypothetical protein